MRQQLSQSVRLAWQEGQLRSSAEKLSFALRFLAQICERYPAHQLEAERGLHEIMKDMEYALCVLNYGQGYSFSSRQLQKFN